MARIKAWIIVAVFGLAYLTPATFSVYVLIDQGLPPALTIFLFALAYPALLIPVLPKTTRNQVLKGGWPAKVSFGVPGIAMGIVLLQLSIFEIDNWPFVTIAAVFGFSFSILFMGALLLFADFTDAQSLYDKD